MVFEAVEADFLAVSCLELSFSLSAAWDNVVLSSFTAAVDFTSAFGLSFHIKEYDEV